MSYYRNPAFGRIVYFSHKGSRILGMPGWLTVLLALALLPLILVVVTLATFVVLVLSLPTGIRVWRALRRSRKMQGQEVIEGEYWVRDDDLISSG